MHKVVYKTLYWIPSINILTVHEHTIEQMGYVVNNDEENGKATHDVALGATQQGVIACVNIFFYGMIVSRHEIIIILK